MSDLSDFLERAFSEPWNDKRHNCGLFVADWVQLRTGKDPAADLRVQLHYGTSWQSILKREGGLCQLIAARAKAAGLCRLQVPEAGAIGLAWVLVPGRKGQRPRPHFVGAVAASPKRWAVLTASGLMLVQTPAKLIWRVP